MLFKADGLKILLGPDCACLGMSIDETFFLRGLLTWDVCTLQLVVLVWRRGFLNLSCGKKDALPRAFLTGLHPLSCVLSGVRACVW